MPWRGVTVSEQRQRFLEDYRLNYYPVTELAERFGVSRKTANPGLTTRAGKWIGRFEEQGQSGFHEHSRRPHRSPSQTAPAIVQALVELRKAHPHWGPRKLLDLMQRRHRQWELPAVSTAARILAREGLARSRRRTRRAHPGCPKSTPQGPNDIWAADYKGQFRLKDGRYCFPLTVSDLASRYVLGCDAHPAISRDKTIQHFTGLFETYWLRHSIRTLDPSPPAPWPGSRSCRCDSSSWASNPSCLSWRTRPGIEPGEPQQPAQAVGQGTQCTRGCTLRLRSGCTAR